MAIGTFDGVHVGHREVVRGNDTVLTFDPHPMSVIHPEATPKLVMPFEIKRDLIAGLGVDELVVIPFDREFAVARGGGVRGGRADRPARRRRTCRWGRTSASAAARAARPSCSSSYDEFETRVVPLVEVGGETVSSSQIRGLVAAGEVREAAQLPRRARSCSRARWCTATSAAASWACPPPTSCPTTAWWCPGHGVYAGWAHGHPAAINVGVRPTFETGRGLLVEPYLIDFDGDLYGQTLRIAFVEKLRGEKRFESVDALVEQMQRDVERARDLRRRDAPTPERSEISAQVFGGGRVMAPELA